MLFFQRPHRLGGRLKLIPQCGETRARDRVFAVTGELRQGTEHESVLQNFGPREYQARLVNNEIIAKL